MDIQEIARLHTRYNEPPLTIDIPSDTHATPLLERAGSVPAEDPKPMWRRLTAGQRRAIGVLIVAAIAFPIGMWTASGSKHDAVATNSVQGSTTTVSAIAPAGTLDVQGHEWPPRASSVQGDQTTNEGQSPILAAPQGGSALVSESTPAPAAVAPPVHAAPANKTPVKAPATSQKPTATPVTAPTLPQSSAKATSRAPIGADVKLF
nr:hypothetical protein [uncultured Cupriavidus sp.]